MLAGACSRVEAPLSLRASACSPRRLNNYLTHLARGSDSQDWRGPEVCWGSGIECNCVLLLGSWQRVLRRSYRAQKCSLQLTGGTGSFRFCDREKFSPARLAVLRSLVLWIGLTSSVITGPVLLGNPYIRQEQFRALAGVPSEY